MVSPNVTKCSKTCCLAVVSGRNIQRFTYALVILIGTAFCGFEPQQAHGFSVSTQTLESRQPREHSTAAAEQVFTSSGQFEPHAEEEELLAETLAYPNHLAAAENEHATASLSSTSVTSAPHLSPKPTTTLSPAHRADAEDTCKGQLIQLEGLIYYYWDLLGKQCSRIHLLSADQKADCAIEADVFSKAINKVWQAAVVMCPDSYRAELISMAPYQLRRAADALYATLESFPLSGGVNSG